MEISPEDAATTDVLGFTRDGSALLLLSSLDANASRLVRHDLASGEQQSWRPTPRTTWAGSGSIRGPWNRRRSPS